MTGVTTLHLGELGLASQNGAKLLLQPLHDLLLRMVHLFIGQGAPGCLASKKAGLGSTLHFLFYFCRAAHGQLHYRHVPDRSACERQWVVDRG